MRCCTRRADDNRPNGTMTRDELRERWAARREEYERLRVQVDGARVIAEFLSDLESVEHDSGERLLSLQQAAELSGYSAEHLARLVRAGTIPNGGRHNKPLIRLADVPRKPKQRLDKTLKKAYDPIADARDLLSRRGDR